MNGIGKGAALLGALAIGVWLGSGLWDIGTGSRYLTYLESASRFGGADFSNTNSDWLSGCVDIYPFDCAEYNDLPALCEESIEDYAVATKDCITPATGWTCRKSEDEVICYDSAGCVWDAGENVCQPFGPATGPPTFAPAWTIAWH